MGIELLAGLLFCSLAPVPTVQPGFAVIATPTRDTVLAGPGSVEFIVADGHIGRASSRTIYGQRVRIERTLTPGSAGMTEAVLVPWDMAPDCTPVPWSATARWAQIGRRAVFYGQLRPRDQWLDSVPTVDVFGAHLKPYPEGFREDLSAGEILTVDEFAELLERLPPANGEERDGSAAFRRLSEWLDANPGVRGREPAAGLARMVRFRARAERIRAIEPAVAGTYRFTVTVTGAPPLSFYARTVDRPTGEYGRDRSSIGDRAADALIEGYSLLTGVADRVEELPTDRTNRSPDREGYLNVLLPAEGGTGQGTRTGGSAGFGLLRASRPSDSLFVRLARDFRFESRLGRAGEFRIGPGNDVSFSEEVDLGAGRTLRIEAVRISLRTIPWVRSGGIAPGEVIPPEP
ncbi:MAG: hypothetical protein AB7S39_07265 [Gemmatimonadales bacterium]